MSKIEIGSRPDYGTFIPAFLDDYPLNANEFRLYVHILKNAGTEKGHCESIGQAAKHCGMNVKTARSAMKLLSAAGLVRIEHRSGLTSLIHPTPYDQWADPGIVQDLRKKPDENPDPTNTDADKFAAISEGVSA